MTPDLPDKITVASPITDFTVDVYVLGRAYPTEAQARAAWQRAAELTLEDAGSTRLRDPADPTGPARYVVWLAFGADGWKRIEPYTRGGDRWEVDGGLAAHLIRTRIEHALAGEKSWRTERPT